MRVKFCLGSALFMAAVSLIAPAAKSQSFEATSPVPLRAKPSARAEAIRVLRKRESVSQINSDSVSHGFIWVDARGDTGWVASRYLRRVTEAPSELAASAIVAPPSAQLATCPIVGTAQPGSTDALSNTLKRRIPPPGPTKTLTFADFATLQQDVEQVFGIDARRHKLNLNTSQRVRLRSLQIPSGTIGEGDRVRLAGYIVNPTPHANTGESVNCGLHGPENNDFHITVADHPNDTGFQGVVVEMIPQGRPDGWNLQSLQQLENNHTLVLVVGQLFYDEKHLVNDDPSIPRSGQPQRFSLFEIHPITAFMICQTGNQCDANDPSGWTPLPL
jgi:hypothetical protein